MDAVLLDTDVFSFVFKRDSRAVLYAPELDPSGLCVSFQTVAELRCWSRIRRWSDARRADLERALAHCVLLPWDNAMCEVWAQITAHRRQLGRPIECGDAWIAATALRYGVRLATHNPSDFSQIVGLQIITHSNSGP
jgi:predicted nucleic acid-binding protein